jgi:hypothetical protein
MGTDRQMQGCDHEESDKAGSPHSGCSNSNCFMTQMLSLASFFVCNLWIPALAWPLEGANISRTSFHLCSKRNVRHSDSYNIKILWKGKRKIST